MKRRDWLYAAAGTLLPASACADAGPVLPVAARVDRIEVDKSSARMAVFRGERELHRYDVGIGFGGLGVKRWEGDGRTPEGTYRIDTRHRSQRWHRFLHVSYPNVEDQRRYDRLVARGSVPREGGRPIGIGGAIGIHGGHQGPLRLLQRWTAGCIAVRDREAEELYAAVVPGAVIVIRP